MFLFQQCSMPDGTETTRTEFVTPKVVQSGHLSPEGSVALCFVNVADDAVAFDLVLSKWREIPPRPCGEDLRSKQWRRGLGEDVRD